MSGALKEQLSRRRARRPFRLGLVLVVATAGAGCSSTDIALLDVSPKRWDATIRARGLDPAEVPMPMGQTPEIVAFARQTAGSGGTDRERLERLQAALFDRKAFAFEYEKMATFTAAEAFTARKGNCVSLTNLLMALARAVGIRLRPALILRRQASEQQNDLVLRFAHMVAVYTSDGSTGASGTKEQRTVRIYDFYLDRPNEPGHLTLLDDVDVASIAASNLAVEALRAGDFARARTLFERAVRLGPGIPEVYAGLGVAQWRQGDVDAAFATFRKGLELAPSRASLLNNLAVLYIEQGKQEEARIALAAANLSEASPHFFVAKGNLELAHGDVKGAIRSYKRAHSRDKTFVEPLLGIARAEETRGRTEAARKALMQAARLAPEDQRVRALLAASSSLAPGTAKQRK